MYHFHHQLQQTLQRLKQPNLKSQISNRIIKVNEVNNGDYIHDNIVDIMKQNVAVECREFDGQDTSNMVLNAYTGVFEFISCEPMTQPDTADRWKNKNIACNYTGT